MVDADSSAFDRAFRRVLSAFRVRLASSERDELTTIYFKVLAGYELAEVLAAGLHCIQTLKKFPVPADWIEALETARSARGTRPEITCRQMTTTEVEELTAAEGARYEGAVCTCVACAESGIARPIRFVPTLVNGTEDRAYHPRRQRVEIVGHWAHGAELVRWYAARDRFFDTFKRVKGTAVGRALALVVRDREPGEEG